MKKFVLGFLTAALLFTALPIGAAIEEYICYKADYKVIVNGTEYINDELPILNYKGSTYAPFRSLLKAAGLNVNWDAELKRAEVTTPNPTQPIAQNAESPTVEEPLTAEPITEPLAEPPVEPSAEPEQVEYITFVYAGAYNSTSMFVVFPESMDVAAVTNVTNYKIYESDKTTLTAFQPATAAYTADGNLVDLTLTSPIDKLCHLYIEVSPLVRNANGNKSVDAGKIQFAAPGFPGQ